MAEHEHPHHPDVDEAILQAFIALFFPRQDIHAKQIADGSQYLYYQQPVNLDLVKRHLYGEVTLGTYALTKDNHAYWVVIDADDDDEWLRILDQVSQSPSLVYLEQSRRGGHAWLFFEEPIPGKEARQFGKALMKRLKLAADTELFPKQDQLADGPGSLIRLPLGFHRKVKVSGKPGQRFGFQTLEGRPLAATVREQLALLAAAQRVPHSFFRLLVAEASEPQRSTPQPTSPFTLRPIDHSAPLSERIKQAISVFDFVSRYVELDGQGIGFCPFHEDTHKSFGVDINRNYWNCFAGCGKGTVIDFWMLWREWVLLEDGSFTATIKDLADLLGL